MRHLTLTIGLFLGLTAVQAAPLQFESARIPEAPPGAPAITAYMTIVNDSDREKVISRVESGDFGTVELHRSVVEDGVAKMKPVGTLRIPAHDSVTLEPGGMHLMLIDPKQHYTDGELLRLIFEESDGTRHALGVVVKKQYGRPKPPSHQHE